MQKEKIEINYKYTTLGLLLLLIVTYAWRWDAILHPMNGRGMMMGNMQMDSRMHQMPDGSMMMSDGSSMGMGSMTMDEMVGMMKGKTGKALEKEFLIGMVPHHQGAVDMARIIIADPSVSAQVKAFAEEIITAQEKEINMMNEWLKKY